MKKYIPLFIIGLLILIYFIGPKTVKFDADDKLPAAKANIAEEVASVLSRDSQALVKSGNQSFFVFADSIPQKRPVVVLYLHGFAASPF